MSSDYENDDSFHNENYNDEENSLKDKLEDIELGKLLQVKSKIEYQEKLNISKNINRKKIEKKFEKINLSKIKSEPKEFSALIKPKKDRILKEKNLNVKKALRRDPRFDDMSGTLNEDMYKKNFSFVNDIAKEYISNIDKIKKKKKKLRIDESQYELIKKQTNLVKGWLNKNKYDQTKEKIKKEIKIENKDRVEHGKAPVYIKDKVVKKLASEAIVENKGSKEMKTYLKRKKHREIVKTRKEEDTLK